MTYNFTYNSINVEINTDNATIKYLTPGFTNLDTIWTCDLLELRMNSNAIVVKPQKHFEDTGVKFGKSEFLEVRRINNTVPTLTGAGQYDFFAGLTNQSLSLEQIFIRAMINNQLEALSNIFGRPLACFNVYSNWDFFLPIEVEISNTSSVITANVITEGDFQFKLETKDNELISDWDSVNTFLNLSPNSYLLTIRNENDSGQRTIEITI